MQSWEQLMWNDTICLNWWYQLPMNDLGLKISLLAMSPKKHQGMNDLEQGAAENLGDNWSAYMNYHYLVQFNWEPMEQWSAISGE